MKTLGGTTKLDATKTAGRVGEGGGLRVLDLFCGAAGGWSLGLHRAGFETVAACESIDWRRQLFAENNPGAILYDDVRTLTAGRLVRDLGFLPDIIVGSPPCQDISSANTRGVGVDGERSGLFFEAVRIIGECRPRWFALENSDRIRTRGYDRVAAALEALGYPCWPFVVGAGNAGLSHKRKRCFILGMDADAASEQARASGQPWVGADAYSKLWEAPRPTGGWRGRSEEEIGGAHGQMAPDADSDELWLQQVREDGPLGSRATFGWLSSIFSGPPRSQPLGSHLRAYDGLSAGVAEQCRQAFGDAVAPQCAEAIGLAIRRVEAALTGSLAVAA